jgi:signal transduction histidine kinase
MSGVPGMEKNEIYKALESDFTSTFIHELMPGVLHNFANPLNGIMGRSKLLQRRIDDTIRKMNERYPETASGLRDELSRINNDIRSINKETESFFEMFRDISGKFYSLAARGSERINLSQLLAAEIRFANFYLEFKHEVSKNFDLQQNIPELQGDISVFSMAFWSLIRFAMTRALHSQEKEIFLKTEHDSENIIISITYSGTPFSDEEYDCMMKSIASESASKDTGIDHGVLNALNILKKYQVGVQISNKDGKNVMNLTLPHQKEKTERQNI